MTETTSVGRGARAGVDGPATAETWDTGIGDGAGVYLRVPGRSGHLRIGDFGCSGLAPGGSAMAVERARLAAAAPLLHAALAGLVAGVERAAGAGVDLSGYVGVGDALVALSRAGGR